MVANVALHLYGKISAQLWHIHSGADSLGQSALTVCLICLIFRIIELILSHINGRAMCTKLASFPFLGLPVIIGVKCLRFQSSTI